MEQPETGAKDYTVSNADNMPKFTLETKTGGVTGSTPANLEPEMRLQDGDPSGAEANAAMKQKMAGV